MIGLILLAPAIIGVFLFLMAVLRVPQHLPGFDAGWFWSGEYFSTFDGRSEERRGSGGFSSPMPVYLGLMAIAGAYLFKK